MKISGNIKGITLIALVITIIVVLILAGLSIAMLTGENGILTKAQTASEQTKQKGAEEKVKLAVAGSWGNDGKINIEELKNNLNNVEGIDKSTIKESLPMTVKVDGYDVNIESTGKVESNNGGSEETGLPSTDNTKPYLPSGDFTQVEGTTLDNGLTIKDNVGNSYVWVEVPKSIYTTATSNTDYSNIETDMQTYAADYRNSDYEDVWYESCGITEEEYNKLKQTMLKSLYDNGGFWIAQYEAGTNTIRTSPADALTTVISKEGAYPYNWITVNQAQELASKMNSGNYKSSLMYGIQWDLTMKYIEAKGEKTVEQIKSDSSEWGNYYNSSFSITKGKYSIDVGETYIDVIENYLKEENQGALLTTGASQRNCVLNIYDLAGNVYERTLEKSNTVAGPTSSCGGKAYNYSYQDPATGRDQLPTTGEAIVSVGFRVAIY